MRTSAALAAVLLFAGPGGARRAAAAMSPLAEAQLDVGVRRLYALDYEASRDAFRKIIEAEPDNPWGYLFESGAIWWQSSMEYGLFRDTPTLQGLFEQDVDAAIKKGEPWTDSKDRAERADGHFILGMALGTRGQWSLMKHDYLGAYFDGRKALKHLKKCLKLDPDYNDAYLGLGVYDYQAARMGGFLRLGGAIIGVRGDEQRGLKRIRLALDHGRYGGRQAGQFLATMYLADQDDAAAALPVVNRLLEHFPDSVYYRFLEVLVHARLHDWPASISTGRGVFESARSDPEGYKRKLLSLVCGLSADRCLSAASVRAARDWFDRALAAPESKPVDRAWVSTLHLYRGYASDMLGETDEAAQDFRRVLALPPFLDNHARARECLEESCDSVSFLRYLRALSRGEPWPIGVQTLRQN